MNLNIKNDGGCGENNTNFTPFHLMKQTEH